MHLDRSPKFQIFFRTLMKSFHLEEKTNVTVNTLGLLDMSKYSFYTVANIKLYLLSGEGKRAMPLKSIRITDTGDSA